MDILSENKKKLLEKAREEFCAACSGKLSDFQNSQKLQSYVAGVKTALDSFRSPTFIVSCVGMLKSGKSTLVNLFARTRHASPTGYGYDATLRPALITYCREEDANGKIEIWFPPQPEDKNSVNSLTETIFNDLFNLIRGVDNSENINKFSLTSCELTDANLKIALCKEAGTDNMLPSEPALIVVRVPKHKDSLLSSEIMILDTPGLDSGLSEWTKKENEGRYSWIINNSDLLLFLQSTVAPLNEKAKDILRDIRAHNSQMPIWLVQNEMLLMPWLPDDRIREETERQKKQASKLFNEAIRSDKQLSANLGKANSGVFDDTLEQEQRNELKEESRFFSMEERVRADLSGDLSGIRFDNCKSNVQKALDKVSSEVKKLIEESKKREADEERLIAEFRHFEELIKEKLLNPPVDFTVIDRVEDIRPATDIPFNREGLYDMLDQEYVERFSREKYKHDEVKKIIEDIKAKLIERIQYEIRSTKLRHFRFEFQERKAFASVYLKEKFEKYAEDLRQAALFGENVFGEETRRETENLWKVCLGQVTIPDFPDMLGVKVSDLGAAIHIEIHDSGWNFLFELVKMDRQEVAKEFMQYYARDEKKTKFVQLIDECEKKMIANLFTWLNKSAYNALRDDFIRKIEEAIKAKTDEREKQRGKYEQDIIVLQKMLDGCGNVEKCIMELKK